MRSYGRPNGAAAPFFAEKISTIRFCTQFVNILTVSLCYNVYDSAAVWPQAALPDASPDILKRMDCL